MLKHRRLVVFAADILLIASAFSLSFLLRFDFTIPPDEHEQFLRGLLVVLAIKPVIFVAAGTYRNIWKYASLQDGIAIGKVVTLSTFITTFVLVLTQNKHPMPRSIHILDWFLLFAFISAARLAWEAHPDSRCWL
jgi:FlaA1/EpsC-like NDP-sugar epimerase